MSIYLSPARVERMTTATVYDTAKAVAESNGVDRYEGSPIDGDEIARLRWSRPVYGAAPLPTGVLWPIAPVNEYLHRVTCKSSECKGCGGW